MQHLFEPQPSEDIPQMICAVISERDGRVRGVIWAEALGNLGIGHSRWLSEQQMERMVAQLERWLQDAPETFADSGASEVRGMIGKLNACIERRRHQELWREQCETSIVDHLL